MRYILRLYPDDWRDRYGEELEALLEQRSPSVLDSIDIARGALDAQLHARTHRHHAAGQRGNDVIPLERDEMRDELRAILSAREELGPDAEQNLVEHFLDRLDERGLTSYRGSVAANRDRLMIRRIETLFGVLGGMSVMALLLVAMFLPLSTESQCSSNGWCVVHPVAVWGLDPPEAIGYTVAGLLLSALLLGLTYFHARTRNSSLLTLMWLLVPTLLASVHLSGFSMFGIAALLLGVFTLLAALTGSALQFRTLRRASFGGR